MFLDESYCHVDHSAKLTWVRPGGVVNELGRKPMLVMFAAFVVYRELGMCKATVIKESVHVWPVHGGEKNNVDYHGCFDADKFDRLFDQLCQNLQLYGPCVIHMDGPSYHKKRTNKVPTAKNKKNEILD